MFWPKSFQCSFLTKWFSWFPFRKKGFQKENFKRKVFGKSTFPKKIKLFLNWKKSLVKAYLIGKRSMLHRLTQFEPRQAKRILNLIFFSFFELSWSWSRRFSKHFVLANYIGLKKHWKPLTGPVTKAENIKADMGE
jgi:hypothetical protein